MNGDYWGSVWLSQRFGNIAENCGFLRDRHRICPKINFIVNSHIRRSYHFSKVVPCQPFTLQTSFFNYIFKLTVSSYFYTGLLAKTLSYLIPFKVSESLKT